MKSSPRILAPLLGLAFIGSASAAVVTGVTATATSTYGSLSVTRLVDNSGLSAPDDVTATHALFDSPNGWHSSGGAVDDVSVTLNLNGAYDLDKIYIWQMNQFFGTTDNSGRGVRQFDLLVSSNGIDFTEVASNLELARATNGPVSAQAFALNQNGITHVRIGLDTAWSGSTNEYVGLDEVKFTTIPEPAAALLGGLGLLGLLRRRRA